MAENAEQITEMLHAWRGGDRAALDQLMPIVMDELKRIAGAYLSREAGARTLQTTALVHEAYLRLVGVQPEGWENRAHFYALAAQMMRRILVDHARARRGLKRGGAWRIVPFEESMPFSAEAAASFSELDEALKSLEKADPRKSKLAELRLFGGLSNEEAASVLGISLRTVVRDWQFAKAWLGRELGYGVPVDRQSRS
jgi:RNA polymerase sigma-70 factor, ECF subfamily